jgi:hypothetical protein
MPMLQQFTPKVFVSLMSKPHDFFKTLYRLSICYSRKLFCWLGHGSVIWLADDRIFSAQSVYNWFFPDPPRVGWEQFRSSVDNIKLFYASRTLHTNKLILTMLSFYKLVKSLRHVQARAQLGLTPALLTDIRLAWRELLDTNIRAFLCTTSVLKHK